MAQEDMARVAGALARLKRSEQVNDPPGGLLSDVDIMGRLRLPDDSPWRLRIDPWFSHQVKTLADGSGRPAVSYGLTSCGYDVRLGQTFRHLREVPAPAALGWKLPPVSPFADQKDVWCDPFVVEPGQGVVIPPHGCLLAETMEWVRVPEDVGVLVLCKSTWARCFANLNTTPLEPGWEGTVTLEIHNQSARELEVFAGHGIGQLWFLKTALAPAVPYNARPNPTYQNQKGPTPAKLRA